MWFFLKFIGKLVWDKILNKLEKVKREGLFEFVVGEFDGVVFVGIIYVVVGFFLGFFY